MKKTEHVWRVPTLIGAASLIGLVVALVADGWAATLCVWLGYVRRA